ncbi:unnamed protein product [Debaryomyces tyrocola]|nr:unnamed protein product [Debaryomyces tyrocola]
MYTIQYELPRYDIFLKFLYIMMHWILSNIPWKRLVFILILQVAAYFCLGNNGFGLILVLGILGIIVCLMIVFIPLDLAFNEIIEEILISEFLEKRPFKESSLKRQEILEEILSNVNKKVNHILGANYGYISSYEMVRGYKRIISRFEDIFDEVYKETPIEEIQGWDRVLLLAKTVQDEDLRFIYEDLVPPELASKSCGIKRPINFVPSEYELNSVNKSKDVSNNV